MGSISLGTAPDQAPVVLPGQGNIPLRNRHGKARAWAVVDLADYADVSKVRWHLHRMGYAARLVGGRKDREYVLMHRYLLGLSRGDGLEADHIDHDKLNNRRSNLRVATHAENHQNRRAGGDSAPSSSRYRGVYWNAKLGRWAANGALDGKTHYLGMFDTEEQAAEAARVWRAQRMPFSVN